jgi:hypothetical protein
MSKITVVACKPGKKPEAIEIENNLAAMQHIVGGFIQLVVVGEFDLFVNEEGHLLDLAYNRDVMGLPIVGPLFISKADDEGETIGLTPEEVQEALRLLEST